MIAKKYKTMLRQLIEIAEHGNDYNGLSDISDIREVGSLIADIQNWLGENSKLLDKFNLTYDSSPY